MLRGISGEGRAVQNCQTVDIDRRKVEAQLRLINPLPVSAEDVAHAILRVCAVSFSSCRPKLGFVPSRDSGSIDSPFIKNLGSARHGINF